MKNKLKTRQQEAEAIKRDAGEGKTVFMESEINRKGSSGRRHGVNTKLLLLMGYVSRKRLSANLFHTPRAGSWEGSSRLNRTLV